MRSRIFMTGVSLLSVMFSSMVMADVRRIWDEKPLTLILPIGQELRVTFPTDVNVQVPLGISEKLTSLAPNPKMIYWTASETFSNSRIIATATDGRTVYVIDISAEQNASKEDVVIEDPSRVLPTHDAASLSSDTAQAASENNADSEALEDPAEIILTRFASQSLYAPTRLIPVDPRIAPINFLALQKDFPLLQSGHGEQVHVTVVGSWTGFGLYVTAVLIVNQTPVQFEFDASRLRGNFTHITAQHLLIGPKGTLTDRTTLYLISESPFAEALTEDSYAY